MKILIYKHSSIKSDIDDDISKIIPYFGSDFVKQFIDIKMTIDVFDTRVSMVNAPNKLFYPNQGKYDMVMYVFEKGTFNLDSQANTSLTIPSLVTSYVSVDKLSDNIDYIWKIFIHEILHGIVFLKDKNIPNVLDFSKPTPYFKSDEPFAPDGNFAQQLALLKDKPIVRLNRIEDDGVQTLGVLMFEDFKCRTLERPYVFNKPNISSIPKGTYQVKYTFSPKFLKYTYEVQNVPHRSGIRIHTGNYFFDIQGCILLGDSYRDLNSDGKTDVCNSRVVVAIFEKKMGKRDFTLIIS